MLGVDLETLRRWDKEGVLKPVRIGTRYGLGDRRYKLEDVEKYIENNKKR